MAQASSDIDRDWTKGKEVVPRLHEGKHIISSWRWGIRGDKREGGEGARERERE